MFYSGESAHEFQYIEFSQQKYIYDSEWFLANKGYSVEHAVQILRAFSALHNKKVIDNYNEQAYKSPEDITFLPGYIYSAEEIQIACGLSKDLVLAFLESFSKPSEINNSNFNSLDDFNYLNAYPLIKITDEKYLCFQSFLLAQAFYETPFFWMNDDKPYRNSLAKHRGRFTEAFMKSSLDSVFGKERVFENVLIREKNKNEIVGEIDVLVIFGDRAVVVQAKSKRLTLEARKGNELALSRDFNLAVQESYDQGLGCSRFLLDTNFQLFNSAGKIIPVPQQITEIYIACIVSDFYPGLNAQSRSFLKYEASEKICPPLVTDVFFIDVLCEFLNSPLLLLSYLSRRLRYTEKVSSTNEHTVLGYHLSSNLWLEDENTFIHLDDSIATDLDIGFLSRRAGLPGEKTPPGLLTNVANPKIALGKIIQQIEHEAIPKIIDFGFFLLTLNGETIQALNKHIKRICTQTARDKVVHDITMKVGDCGITIHSNDAGFKEAIETLRVHCERRKYSFKVNKFYGLLLSSGNDFTIRTAIFIDGENQPSSQMDAILDSLQKIPEAIGGEIHDYSGLPKKRKVGRNDPCPCGSNVKAKKCCFK